MCARMSAMRCTAFSKRCASGSWSAPSLRSSPDQARTVPARMLIRESRKRSNSTAARLRKPSVDTVSWDKAVGNLCTTVWTRLSSAGNHRRPLVTVVVMPHAVRSRVTHVGMHGDRDDEHDRKSARGGGIEGATAYTRSSRIHVTDGAVLDSHSAA